MNRKLILSVVVMLLLLPFGLQARNYSVTLTDATPQATVEILKKSTGYNFVYRQKAFDKIKLSHISDTFKDVSLEEILDRIFVDKLGLDYEIIDKTVIILPPGEKKEIKTSISGTVVDEEGEPLPGASVIVKGTTKGVSTDIDGGFKLEVSGKNPVLVVSYVGMYPTEYRINENNMKPLRIILRANTNLMSEVVFTGYQTLSSERSAGSFNVLKSDAIGEKLGMNSDVLQSVEGLVAGLGVNMSEGADKYTVRGISSINSTRSPLFVVDGVPLESGQIESLVNGNDIESISVLKDATAASIWGSQAANGVVVITTKKGQAQSRPKISYNGSFAWTGKPDYGYLDMMSPEIFIKNASEMFELYSKQWSYENVKTSNVGTSLYNPVVLPHERIMYRALAGEISDAERDEALRKLAGQDGRKDYEKYMMSDKWLTRHNISINGGVDKATYYFSLGYVGDKGYQKNQTNTFIVNTREDFKLAPWLKWDVTFNGSIKTQKAHLTPWSDVANDKMRNSNSIFGDIPYALLYQDGKPVDWMPYYVSDEKRETVEKKSGINMSFYPVDDFLRSSNKLTGSNLRFNTGLTFDFYRGLRFETRFQYSDFRNKTEMYWPQENWKIREELLASTPADTPQKPALPASGGNFNLINAHATDWTFRNQFTYNGSFNEGIHEITALAGTEIRENKNTGFTDYLRGYDIQSMTVVDYDKFNLTNVRNPLLGQGLLPFYKETYRQTEYSRRYFSLYANVAYTFRHKYDINASVRMDQSNLFGSDPGSQYKPIWSVGGAWRINKEKFMSNITWLNRLTLRATYGYAGNSPNPGQGGPYDILTAGTSSFYEGPGFSISTPANGKITWEKTRTYNVGFDVSVINNRINVNFDFYNKHTTDLISDMLLNPATGWDSTIGNIGEITNKGFELTVNTTNIKTRDFSWETTLTAAHNSNKIDRLEVATPYTASTLASVGSHNVEGYPVNSLFSYRWAGLNDKGEPQVYTADGKIVSGADSRSLSADDVVFSGTIVPKLYGGLTNRLTYKNWTLSFLFIYSVGNKMRNECVTVFNNRLTANQPSIFDNRWRKPGDEKTTDIPAWQPMANSNANYNLYYYGDNNILNASYFKLRDISVYYFIPKSFCRKFSAESCKIGLSAANLLTWTANSKGIDPEYYQLSSYTGGRVEKPGRTVAVELNINF